MNQRVLAKQKPSQCQSIIKLSALLIFLWILASNKDIVYFNKRAEDNENEGQLGDATKNDFVWSEKSNTWALSEKSVAANHDSKRRENSCIWPTDCDCGNDRIVDQLLLRNFARERIFKIFPPIDQNPTPGGEIFLQDNCPISNCQITYNESEADALIFLNSDVKLHRRHIINRTANQIWIAYLLESPSNTFDKKFRRANRGDQVFNWTASYRSDSDIVTPYSKFVPYFKALHHYQELKSLSSDHSEARKILLSIDDHRKLEKRLGSLTRKSGKVAWFVSNCNAANARLQYAKELSQYIQVDIYGKCGHLTCDKWNQTGCDELINENYKFYLSFENSNCRQYLTEKLYKNALGYNNENHLILPIVMGPKRADYDSFAPPASFIHVDDFSSPKHLASYLKLLDGDEGLYSTYFIWKLIGRFIETKFMCRVCSMLNQSFLDPNRKTRSYSDIIDWWNKYNCDNSSSSKISCE